MFWIENTYAKVWKIDPSDNYTTLQISTSEKDYKHEGQYINSSWFARAIGHAHEQIKAGYIHEGDRVQINKGKISNERYTDKETNETKSTVRVVILEFNIDDAEKQNTAAPKKSKPKTSKKSTVAEAESNVSDEDLPF